MTRSLLAPLAAGLLALGCHSTSPTQATPSHSAALRVGEPAVIANTYTVVFVRVDNDSRCPIGALCITNGDATVVFTAVPAGVNGLGSAVQQFLHTDTSPKSLFLPGYVFTLDSLLPRPTVGHAIQPGDYRAYVTLLSLPD